MPAATPIIDPQTHVHGYGLDPADVARALDSLYFDVREYERLSLAGFRHATSARFSWSRIEKEWHGLLSSLAGSP